MESIGTSAMAISTLAIRITSQKIILLQRQRSKHVNVRPIKSDPRDLSEMNFSDNQFNINWYSLLNTGWKGFHLADALQVLGTAIHLL
jgi:hypothetical protein